MQNKMLQTIIDATSKKYGKEASRSIFSAYGDDVAKKGAKSFLGKELAGTNTAPKMVSYHGISSDKMTDMIKNTDSYSINPSIQTVDPAKNMGGDFGEILLMANKDMVNPYKRGVQTYNRDIYSPRFPTTDETGHILGMGTDQSPEAISAFMNKKALKGGEDGFSGFNPGSVAAKQARPFKSIREMVEKQDNILDQKSTHDALDKFRDDLADITGEISDSITASGSDYGWSEAEAEMADLLKGKAPFYEHTPEVMQKVQEIRQRAKKLPTDYFETKVTKPVHLSEFSGAMLPEGFDDPRILEALEANGIPILDRYNQKMYNYETSQNPDLQSKLNKLTSKDRLTTPYLMGTTGVLGAGGILSALMGNEQTYDNM